MNLLLKYFTEDTKHEVNTQQGITCNLSYNFLIHSYNCF